MRKLIIFLSTGCLSGYLPVAPGTWGTVVGVGLYWLLHYLPHPLYATTLVGFIALSVWVSEEARKIFGVDDPPKVVIDEIAGYLVTMAFFEARLWIIIAGFVLFRIFDIVKPWPARWIERKFRNGAGIVFDDIVAGIYANAVLWIIIGLLSVISDR